VAATQAPIWQQVAADFSSSSIIYLNHAGVSPLCRPAVEAMTWVTRDAFENGSYYYEGWMKGYERLRLATAKLINAHRDEIAIVKNTSEGIATVQLGLDWNFPPTTFLGVDWKKKASNWNG
jgi:cysteine desulfurase / selenocysteine lyase